MYLLLLFYFLIGIQDVKCQCDNNCKECSSFSCSLCFDNFAPYRDKCYPCWDGYHSSGDVCRQCSFGCSKCSSIKTCQKCFESYELNGNGTCSKSSCNKKNCKNCDTQGLCVECIDGFKQLNGTFTECDSNCKNCDSQGCYECNQGFTLNQSSCIQQNYNISNSNVTIITNNSNNNNNNHQEEGTLIILMCVLSALLLLMIIVQTTYCCYVHRFLKKGHEDFRVELVSEIKKSKIYDCLAKSIEKLCGICCGQKQQDKPSAVTSPQRSHL
ncbi:hypothetical protein pb186bvf_012117 [Paramecium bursaria]